MITNDRILRINQTFPTEPYNKVPNKEKKFEPELDKSFICRKNSAVPHANIDTELKQSTNTNICNGLNLIFSICLVLLSTSVDLMPLIELVLVELFLFILFSMFKNVIILLTNLLLVHKNTCDIIPPTIEACATINGHFIIPSKLEVTASVFI